MYADSDKLSKEEKDKRRKILPSFWVPSLTPDAVKKQVAKPSQHASCPSGGHVLRMSQLKPIKWTALKEIDKTKDEKQKKTSSFKGKTTVADQVGRFECAGCGKSFTNSIKMAQLRKCGHVHCSGCVEALIKKDHACVDCGEAARDKDIVYLEAGGRGFAAHGAALAVAQVTPAFN